MIWIRTRAASAILNALRARARKRGSQAGKEPADELRTLDLSDKILLCEDISCGVVPIDPEQRAWREAVGRMNAMLAARAERVTRIFCGLPMELKG